MKKIEEREKKGEEGERRDMNEKVLERKKNVAETEKEFLGNECVYAE